MANEDRVKGVVVRINSPGGSATASEEIRQALKKLAAKKPTVISMGDVAASGGYWISCIGTPIYAERGTVTGSIGVFAMKLSGRPYSFPFKLMAESTHRMQPRAAVQASAYSWQDRLFFAPKIQVVRFPIYGLEILSYFYCSNKRTTIY